MTQRPGYLQSTIGRKQLVGVAALGLSVFVLTHMAGNLFMFLSPQAYNEYGHALVSNKLLIVAEIGLVTIFLAHAIIAMVLAWKNRQARPERYAVSAKGAKGTSTASKTMAIQGTLILVFVVLHLQTFKYGTHYEVDYGNGPIRDLFRLVAEVFQSPGYVVWYVLSMVVLGVHLSHGVKSIVQTLGIHHPNYQNKIKLASYFYATVVALGFISQPIYMFFFYHGS